MLAQRLNRLELPGVRFRPITFKPAASKHAGRVCEGVQVHVVERSVYEAVRTGLHVLAACRELNPDVFAFLPTADGGQPSHFDRLTGSARVREHLEVSGSVNDLVDSWSGELVSFAGLREPYLLYR